MFLRGCRKPVLLPCHIRVLRDTRVLLGHKVYFWTALKDEELSYSRSKSGQTQTTLSTKRIEREQWVCIFSTSTCSKTKDRSPSTGCHKVNTRTVARVHFAFDTAAEYAWQHAYVSLVFSHIPFEVSSTCMLATCPIASLNKIGKPYTSSENVCLSSLKPSR